MQVQHTALHLAVLKSSLPMVNLLLAHQAPLEHKNNSAQTPLLQAAHNGFWSIAEALTEAGADISVSDHQNHTVLNYADQQAGSSLIEYYISRGYRVRDEDITFCNNDKNKLYLELVADHQRMTTSAVDIAVHEAARSRVVM